MLIEKMVALNLKLGTAILMGISTNPSFMVDKLKLRVLLGEISQALISMEENMGVPEILVEITAEDAKLPERSFPTDSGMDVFVQNVVSIIEHGSIQGISRTVSDTEWKMFPGDRFLIDTGLKVAVGVPGYEIQVRPRSGMALKQGLTVENSPGTVDCNYRGMLGIILINDSSFVHTIKKHDKIAQIVVSEVVLSDIKLVDKLPPASDRNDGGFGHTGK